MSTEVGTGQQQGTTGRLVARSATNEAVEQISAERPDFCQVFCSTKYEYEDVLEGIEDVVGDGPEVFGCSSSGEFTEEGVSAGSVTVSVVSSDSLEFHTALSTGLSGNVEACISDAVSELPETADLAADGYPHFAAVNLHDGLCGVGNTVARLTSQFLGEDVKLAGGSAGDDLRLESTHVFCNDEIATDAVALALIASEDPIPMTVNHGHKPISGTMTVTEAEGSMVHELDGKPAFDVWKQAIRESAMEVYGVDVDDLEAGTDELSMLLTRYEFGIEEEPRQDDADRGLFERLKQFVEQEFLSTSGYNIRWPGQTMTTDGPLGFTVEIPEGTVLRVMHSEPDEQIASVRSAAREAAGQATDTGIAGGFIYDCACRGAILEDEFDRAVEAISQEVDAPFAGFESYGEICSVDEDYTDYHNTSSVVLLLPN